jgi:hypothetical protein
MATDAPDVLIALDLKMFVPKHNVNRIFITVRHANALAAFGNAAPNIGNIGVVNTGSGHFSELSFYLEKSITVLIFRYFRK